MLSALSATATGGRRPSTSSTLDRAAVALTARLARGYVLRRRDVSGFAHGYCGICNQHKYLSPLHGERGGPLCCLPCIGKWDAEHIPRRRARRAVIKALKAYESTGGSLWDDKDFDSLKLAAGNILFGNRIEDDFKDLTFELLTAAVALTHPDRHPPELKAEAQRVTQELLALKPFVFSAPEPKPPKQSKPSDGSSKHASMI
jgi:hypothetical protein